MTTSIRILVFSFAMTTALLLNAGLAIPASSSAQQASMQVAGSTRTYSTYVPEGLAPARGFPVVLVFHGGGMQSEQMRKLTGFDAVAAQHRFLVVYPNGIDKHWNDGRSTIRNPQDDIAFVAALIKQLGERFKVNRGRIYATGLSNGALFTQRLACDLPRDIAAIAPVAGTLPSEITAGCRDGEPVAILQIGGTADPIMPFGVGGVADFGGRGEGGQVQSFAQTTAFWARHNKCGEPGYLEPLPPITLADRTRVTYMRYTRCPADGEVAQLVVNRGGHTWPGGPQYARRITVGLASQQIDASARIADFFLALPLRNNVNW